jgi:hypothetical protein
MLSSKKLPKCLEEFLCENLLESVGVGVNMVVLGVMMVMLMVHMDNAGAKRVSGLLTQTQQRVGKKQDVFVTQIIDPGTVFSAGVAPEAERGLCSVILHT